MLFILNEKISIPPELNKLMPISIRRYTELKLAISDYLQRRNWARLFELCGTSDEETAKTIAVILSFYNPKTVWGFLDYAFKLSSEERREKRDSVVTCCYVLGKIGQTNIKKALSYLRFFLLEDHMLRAPATSALSNLWVLDTRRTMRMIMRNWVLNREENDDLQEVGVKSSQYLAKEAPERISSFLRKVSLLGRERKKASRSADEIISESGIAAKKKQAQRIGTKRNKKLSSSKSSSSRRGS